MEFDCNAYLRLAAPDSLGATMSGMAFATSTGDFLEVSCYGPGIFRLRVGADTKPVYGLGEQFGPLDKRGQLVRSQVENPQGANSGLASKQTPFAWGAGALANGQRGYWGVYVNTPGCVTHGVGYPDWSHRSYVIVVD